jgi:hypothetical protein
MNIKILSVEDDKLVDALIRKGNPVELPSMQEGWRFNFRKNLEKLSNAFPYVLVTQKTPEMIEGCLIFQMKDKIKPYMAFVEIAPHNRAHPKRYENVAGCLIAFAFRESLMKGKDDYMGYLLFDVQEETEEDQNKLIKLYREKYGALHIVDTTLVIADERGEALIERYLTRKTG